MRVQFALDADDVDRFGRLLSERERRGTDMSPALRRIALDFMAVEEQVFASAGRLILGRGWKKLNPTWAAYRARTGRGSRILEMGGGAGGRLRKSLTIPGAPYQRLDISDDEMVVSTRLGIAKVHAAGATIIITNASGQRTVKIPRRRFVRLRREDKVRWIGYAQDYLSNGRVSQRLGL